MKSAGILCRKSEKILLIQKKYTLAFAHFIVGYYKTPLNALQLLNQITKSEKELLMTEEISELSVRYFDCKSNLSTYNELINYLGMPLNTYLTELKITRQDPDWEIPKGKKNLNESDFECAKREFKEETGVIIDNDQIVGECYDKNTHYFMIDVGENVKTSDEKDPKEIKKIEWFNYIPKVSNDTFKIINYLTNYK